MTGFWHVLTHSHRKLAKPGVGTVYTCSPRLRRGATAEFVLDDGGRRLRTQDLELVKRALAANAPEEIRGLFHRG